MNIYKIEFLHAAPKDIETGFKCLLLAENDEQVYEWIKSEPRIGDSNLYNVWSYKEKENKEYEVYNDNYDIIGKENFKQRMIRLKGQMNDDDYDYSDAYYGVTLLGWSLVKENINTDYSKLIESGIVYYAVEDKKLPIVGNLYRSFSEEYPEPYRNIKIDFHGGAIETRTYLHRNELMIELGDGNKFFQGMSPKLLDQSTKWCYNDI